MGENKYYQSGNGNRKKLKSICKLYYFENKKLKIKKIVCGGFFEKGFNIFLTGFNNLFNFLIF
jgi:hypothetical protein